MTGGEPALELRVGERSLRFPAVWQRDNCTCAECRDPGSGRRLKDITEIPSALLLAAAEEAGEVTAFYTAYRRWAALLAQPERQLNLRLAPGDCLIFDNTRILHARTAFSMAGRRHLQGCYADLDGLASTLAVPRREEAQ